jgi:hypothetical protein
MEPSRPRFDSATIHVVVAPEAPPAPAERRARPICYWLRAWADAVSGVVPDATAKSFGVLWDFAELRVSRCGIGVAL